MFEVLFVYLGPDYPSLSLTTGYFQGLQQVLSLLQTKLTSVVSEDLSLLKREVSVGI